MFSGRGTALWCVWKETHSEFEGSDALRVAVPEILHQLSVPLGHHSSHSQGVVPAISHPNVRFHAESKWSGEDKKPCTLLTSHITHIWLVDYREI